MTNQNHNSGLPTPPPIPYAFVYGTLAIGTVMSDPTALTLGYASASALYAHEVWVRTSGPARVRGLRMKARSALAAESIRLHLLRARASDAWGVLLGKQLRSQSAPDCDDDEAEGDGSPPRQGDEAQVERTSDIGRSPWV